VDHDDATDIRYLASTTGDCPRKQAIMAKRFNGRIAVEMGSAGLVDRVGMASFAPNVEAAVALCAQVILP
jgi:hypothetical protein